MDRDLGKKYIRRRFISREYPVLGFHLDADPVKGVYGCVTGFFSGDYGHPDAEWVYFYTGANSPAIF